MTLTLYAPLGNPRAAKIQIVINHLGLEVQYNRLTYEEAKQPAFLSLHPLGKVPLLNTPEGPIYQSNAILRYLARRANSLYGKDHFERAQVDQWLEYQNIQLDPVVFSILYPLFGWGVSDKEKYTHYRKELKEVNKVLDSHLKDRKVLVGDSLTIADIAIANAYTEIFRLILDEKSRQSIPHLTRWFQYISNLPAFAHRYGKIWLCQKELEPIYATVHKEEKKAEKKDQKKNQKKQQHKETTKVEKPVAEKKKKEQKKPEPVKKEAKKEQKKKKKEQDGEEEEQEPDYMPKKKVNPLDLLPKSSFVLDDFKRDISNTTDKIESLKNFWAKYDPQGYSIWKVKYQKYQGQGTVGYLTANLKNGYLRNIDHFRKYSFAAVGVYGVEGNYEIQGIWLWRGTEIPEEWREHQSFEYHTFTRLDHTKEEDRKLLEEYWLNLDQGQLVEGLPVFEAKYFK